MNLSLWLTRIIRYSFYLLFILTPLVLTPWNYELFEYNKMMLTYALTAIITTAWIIKIIHEKKIQLVKTPLDLPIILFILSQLISSIFSIDPHISWFGYYSRTNGGMFSVISYVLLYYAFVNNMLAKTNSKSVPRQAQASQNVKSMQNDKAGFKRAPALSNLLNLILFTAVLVASYGIAEHYGIDAHLWVQDVRTRVFSTLGQPNWLAAYLVALIPLSMARVLKNQQQYIKMPHTTPSHSHAEKTSQSMLFSFRAIFWLFVTGVFFLTLLYSGSRSGFVGLAVTWLLFWVLLLRLYKKTLNRLLTPFLLLSAIFILIVAVQGTRIQSLDRFITIQGWLTRFSQKHEVIDIEKNKQQTTGTVLEVGGTESTTIRRFVWQGALQAWQESLKTKLIGTGTETFAFAFYKHKPKEHNRTSEWDFLYNKAHNEYLNFLTTTGVFGLLSYLIVIVVFMFWFIKTYLYKLKKPYHRYLSPYALFAGYVSILITNFFGFSVVVVQQFLYLFPAILFFLAIDEYGYKAKRKTFSLRLQHPTSAIASVIAATIGVLTVFTIATYWEADRRFTKGYRLSKIDSYNEAAEHMQSAITLNPNEPLYHDEYARVLSQLAMMSAENQDATSTAVLIQNTLAHSDIALSISPQNVNYWKTRTRAYYSFSTFDPIFLDAAIEAITNAKKLAPHDPKVLYNLAVLTGYKADSEKAIEILEETITLKPDYKDAYFALYIFYNDRGDTIKAREILTQYLKTVNPNDKEFLNLVAEL